MATLKDCCVLLTDGDWIESKDQSDQGIRLVQTGNVGNGEYLEKEKRAKYISKDTFQRLGCTEIFPGDILISRLPEPVGRACIIPSKSERMITAVDCSILRVDESVVDKQYLLYFLQSPNYFRQLTGKLAGTTRVRISRKNLEAVFVPIPARALQNEIATIFRHLDKVIQLRKQQITSLDNLIKARFVELFGDPVNNPKGWEKKALSEEAEIKIGPFGSMLHKEDYITGGHALINPSHIIDGKIVVDNDLTISDDKYEELAAYHLREGDVVMGRRGEMGRCAVVDQSGLLCGTGSLLIRSCGDLSADFIQKIISSPSFKRTIEDMAVGQTMPNLNVPIVSAFQIIKPPKPVQEQYYTFAAQVDKSKFTVQKALDEAQMLFDSLMQQYFG